MGKDLTLAYNQTIGVARPERTLAPLEPQTHLTLTNRTIAHNCLPLCGFRGIKVDWKHFSHTGEGTGRRCQGQLFWGVTPYG